MEEQVNKIKIYHQATLQVFVTFSSTKIRQKICQTTLFKSTPFLNQIVHVENIQYQIQCTPKSLEQFQELLIKYYQQKNQPIDEVRLILNSF
ncbi:unnamed protein product [Paramecium primaurelia]|uniref:Uncharacterized protein n=1 Tax=Paramecium primaurelia TaxID=5886 RepID=A0A8S1PYP5_PARPR|nr:unnamed protein product [Paramecium primaurelia]